MKILFLGDIVGEIGIKAIEKYLIKNKYDLVIANAENANQEHGMTIENYKQLLEIGVDCVTSGNHFFETNDIYKYEELCPMAIRPVNFIDAPGKGSILVEVCNKRIRITNLIGRVFINGNVCNPFDSLQEIINHDNSDIHIVDFHAETTWEKRCIAEYFDGKVTAIIGTHTHVQTNDLQTLNNGTLFITDCGMNGAFDSVLGDNKDLAIKKTINMSNIELTIPTDGKKLVNGIAFEIDDNNVITNFRLVNDKFD